MSWQETLQRCASLWMTSMVKLAPTHKIKGAIRLGQYSTTGPNIHEYDLRISLKDAPEALAYELGSGIHNPTNPQTYEIHPKNVRYLAFFWDKVNESSPTGRKFRGISKQSGKAIFTYVDHPGVAARPYMMKSYEDVKEQIIRLVEAEAKGQAARVAVSWFKANV